MTPEQLLDLQIVLELARVFADTADDPETYEGAIERLEPLVAHLPPRE